MTTLATFTPTALTTLVQTLPSALDHVHADYKTVATQAVDHIVAGEPGAVVHVDGVRMSAEEIGLQLALDGYIDPNS